MNPVIVWFRQDLRLRDNPALAAARASGRPVVPLYIWDASGAWSAGAALRYWLHRSLAALDADLMTRNSRLILARGDPRRVLPEIMHACGADAVYWNRRHEPVGRALDTVLEAQLAGRVEVATFNARVLFEPDAIATADGRPYRVFTPFYRACLRAMPPGAVVAAPSRLRAPSRWPASVELPNLGLAPRPDWAGGIRARWPAGEAAALARLEHFVEAQLIDYAAARDLPASDGVSGLSPYLQVGAIGPRLIWHAIASAPQTRADARVENAAAAWLRQLLWREFAYHLLQHFPHTPEQPLRAEFAGMDWLHDDIGLQAWQRGRTGYPLIDAGMRELWATGYMHNRVRMVVASFLCKHLGLHWRSGAEWFWNTLIDADLASNTLGWQWCAGCGADAAPYFRILNPLTQSRRFDPDGRYIRRWVPELAQLPAATIHQPGAHAPAYPPPVLELGPARAAALARYARMRA